ncbi:MAG: choice-of-anchor Q domain-containing protein [Chloroflexota bacterium]
MKNKSLQALFVFLTLLALTLSSLGITPASAQPAAGLPAAGQFLNADGSLNLTTGYSGGLDVSNYSVTLDPVRGPVFSPLAITANAWNALGTGLNNFVSAIAISGTDVYVGGNFTDAGGDVNADYIAKWDGSAWSALGGTPLNNSVYAIALSGTDVYVGGVFTDAGGDANADKIAKWDGSAWSALGTGLNNTVYAIAISGTDVYVGGYFTDAGGDANADYIAKWDGSAWLALGAGLNDIVYAIALSGTDVYVGGYFTDAGGDANADKIAKWNGAAWSALGAGLNNTVNAIVISGTDVYVGGYFTDAGGDTNADYIAKWNGSAWSALGTGLSFTVFAIAISGTDVYVGGGFIDAGGDANADKIAKWDGSAWSALGTGLNNTVYAIAIGGMGVYAGGNFTDAGGDANADKIALYATCATTITVTSGADSGTGSLREALGNVCPGGTINFDNDYHILLDSTLAVTKDLTIDGETHKIILDGQNTVRVMYTEWSPVTATVRNLTIQNGHADTILGISVKAGGGILNLGMLAVENVTFLNNSAVDDGGALFSWNILTVANSTFSGNSATNGGAIYDGTNGFALGTSIVNSTFSGNSATGSGGGALNTTTGAVYIQNSIIANSTSGGNCAGTIFNFGYNLDSGSTCGFGNFNSLSNTDPKLAALADNGGPTPTFALLPGSPAINAGTNTDCPATDQRGVARPQGATCDIGSYEEKAAIFADVPTTHWANSFIERLYNNGITGGCASNPLNYCPDTTVTRAQMAVFLLVAEHGTGYTPPEAVGLFNDVPASNGFAKWIEQLYNEGISGGCGGGNYCPNTPVTREQMSVFLLVAKYGSGYSPAPATGVFNDVPAGNGFAKWIEALAAEGITGGCGGGNFCPKGTVTRAQMAVFLVAAFNLP